MSREILFKAKRKDNGEWAEGFYVKGKWYLDEKEIYAILPLDICFYPQCEIDEWIEVDPETLCQCTGLTDKNEKMIFENDILSGKRYHDLGQGGEYVPDKWVVKWNERKAAFDPISWWDSYSHELKNYEVIGNIIDNLALLEEN